MRSGTEETTIEKQLTAQGSTMHNPPKEVDFHGKMTVDAFLKDQERGVEESGKTDSSPEAEPSEAEPSEAEPSEAEPSEAEPSEAEPSEAEPSEAEPSEAEPSEAEPLEAEPLEAEPLEAESLEAELSAGELSATEASATKASQAESSSEATKSASTNVVASTALVTNVGSCSLTSQGIVVSEPPGSSQLLCASMTSAPHTDFYNMLLHPDPRRMPSTGTVASPALITNQKVVSSSGLSPSRREEVAFESNNNSCRIISCTEMTPRVLSSQQVSGNVISVEAAGGPFVLSSKVISSYDTRTMLPQSASLTHMVNDPLMGSAFYNHHSSKSGAAPSSAGVTQRAANGACASDGLQFSTSQWQYLCGPFAAHPGSRQTSLPSARKQSVKNGVEKIERARKKDRTLCCQC